MNLVLAALSWFLGFSVSSPTGQSRIKSSYPEIPAIDFARERFMASLNGVSADARGLVAGLTIGIRDGISTDTAEQMRTLSLTHLVAVSGANLAIVLATVYFLTAWLGLSRGFRFGLGLLTMASYVLLVGPESSVIRAATMATLVMIGLWLGRGSTPLNSLSLAVVVLLGLDPQLSRDIGFALSVSATAGLLILSPPIFEWLRMRIPEFLALGVAASASAQFFTTPVLLLLQPSLPLYSVVANVLVEPVVAPITVLGILTVLTSLFSIPLASVVSYTASLFSSWILVIAQELSSWPEARIHYLQGSLGIFILSIAIVLISLSVSSFIRNRIALRVIAGMLITFAISASVVDRVRYETFAGNWELLACDVGQGDATLIRSGNGTALIDVGPDPERLVRCLGVANVQKIDLLVLTHFDSDHVAGIEGLADIEIGTVLISGYQDDRPLVSKIKEFLERRYIRPTLGRAGLAGTLGSGFWKVLSPSTLATEAEDSNDASIVVAFEFENWSFVGLGDLGESGQDRLMRLDMPALTRAREANLVLKVAHHGSADQSLSLTSYLAAEYSIFSSGKNNYGHPTQKALTDARLSGSTILRTDLLGPIAMVFGSETEVMVGGKLSA